MARLYGVMDTYVIQEGVSKREAHPLFVPLFKEEMEVVFTQTSYKGNVF